MAVLLFRYFQDDYKTTDSLSNDFHSIELSPDQEMREQVEGALNMPPSYETVVTRAQLALVCITFPITCARMMYLIFLTCKIHCQSLTIF